MGEWFREQGLYLEHAGPQFQILNSDHEPIYEGGTMSQLFAWTDGWKAARNQKNARHSGAPENRHDAAP